MSSRSITEFDPQQLEAGSGDRRFPNSKFVVYTRLVDRLSCSSEAEFGYEEMRNTQFIRIRRKGKAARTKVMNQTLRSTWKRRMMPSGSCGNCHSCSRQLIEPLNKQWTADIGLALDVVVSNC